jgi:hypothetical protein
MTSSWWGGLIGCRRFELLARRREVVLRGGVPELIRRPYDSQYSQAVRII